MNTHCCEEMEFHLKGDDVAIVYIPEFREYGIKILDGGTSFQEIYYCPWCGQKLPLSLRIEWFDKLSILGLEPEVPNVPSEMLTDAWWRNGTEEKVIDVVV